MKSLFCTFALMFYATLRAGAFKMSVSTALLSIAKWGLTGFAIDVLFSVAIFILAQVVSKKISQSNVRFAQRTGF